MKLKKFTKFTVFTVILTLLFSTLGFASDFFTIHNNTESERLSDGITYEHIEKYSSIGWININVVRADLTSEHTKVEPIFNKNGISERTDLTDMLKSNNAVAGINGDFFNMTAISFPMGTLIHNGQVVSSPNSPGYEYPTITSTKDNNFDISIWQPNVYLRAQNNSIFYVAAVNKLGAFKGEIVVLNDSWGSKSIGSTAGRELIEIVVANDVVQAIRINQPSVTIPKNGYVIVCSAIKKDELASTFQVGTNVNLNYEFDFSPQNINWAAGGVNYLVKDGMLYKINSSIKGRHPRTAVGFNKDKTEMILVTVDGRNKNYTGVTQEELAEIMIELGAYEAVNMDGGGSTTMGVDFLRNGNIKVVNFPSDGKQRNVDNGFGIFNTSPISDTVKHIEIVPEYTKVFKDTYVSLKVNAYDQYYNQIGLDTDNLKFETSTKSGEFSDMQFKPTRTGTIEIEASYGDITDSTEIEVFDTPVDLVFENDFFILDKEETYDLGDIIGIDKDGNTAYISPNVIKWSYRNRVGKVDNGIFTAGTSSNMGAITARFGEAVENIYVKVGYKPVTIESFEDFENISYSEYPSNSGGSIEKSSEQKEGAYSLKLNYDFTKMTDQSIAFVDFADGGILLKGKPKAVGMWVYGDSKDHWLRCRITDRTGTLYKLDFAETVDWEGWKWVTAKIPESASYPVKLKNVYLAEINETMKDTGSIYIDNLRALYEPDDKEIKICDETNYEDLIRIEDVKDIGEYDYKLKIENGQIVKDTELEETKDNIVIFTDISKGSINESNITQWQTIKGLELYKDKKIVIHLNGSLRMFNDNRELDVFEQYLEKASVENNIFVVWEGEEEDVSVKNNVRYIQYDDSFELYTSDEEIFYKN